MSKTYFMNEIKHKVDILVDTHRSFSTTISSLSLHVFTLHDLKSPADSYRVDIL